MYYKDQLNSGFFTTKNVNDYKGEGKYQLNSGFLKTDYVTIAMLVFLGCIIILTSYFGIEVVLKCKKKGGTNKSMLRNYKILTTCMGVGTGIISFAFLDIFVNQIILLLFSILVLSICIYVIQSYEKLEDTPKCKEKIQSNYEFMYGVLGASVGILFFALLSNFFKVVKSPLLRTRILLLLASIFSIFISSVSINTSNSCKTKGISKTSPIIILVVNLFVFIAVLVSFRFIM